MKNATAKQKQKTRREERKKADWEVGKHNEADDRVRPRGSPQPLLHFE